MRHNLSKTFDFKEQLAVGNEGEELFLKKYPDLKRLDGRKGDFIGYSGKKIELKTDSYSMNKTPNMFMERWRNQEKSEGGPWQARENGCFYFVYLFLQEGVVYWFETDALIKHLEQHIYNQRTVQNKGWAAIGWLVPRSGLEDLIVKKERLYERD